MALIATLPALLLSCGKNDPSVSTPTIAASATPEPRFSLNVNPEDYFSLFPFHLEWVRDALLSDVYPSPQDGPRYQAVVAKIRAEGMEALSNQERQLLIVVAWYARIMETETTKFRVEERAADGEVSSLTETEETYRFSGSGNKRVPYPVGSRNTFTIKRSDADSTQPDESVSSWEIVDDGGQEDAILTDWARMGDSWFCTRLRASGPMASFYPLPRWHMDQEFAEATPARVEDVNGRSAYKLRAGQSYSIGPFPQYLWVDVETLLPVQEEYDEGEGNTKLITILEINGQVDVAPPNVDVSCPERDYGETPSPE